MLAALLTDFKDALMSGLSGPTRPVQLLPGGMWVDTSQQAPPNYSWYLKLWTGAIDVSVFRININSGFGGSVLALDEFEVTQISADTVGAIQELVKQRIANNGGLLVGDTVAEIQFVGRTLTSTDPVVGYIKFTATDNQDEDLAGGTFSFYSTPDATAAITESLRFIDGLVETPVPLSLNSVRLAAQAVATTAVIPQLSADSSLIEFTGSTPTLVQGIKGDGSAREITLHNRSTATVTLLHNNSSAAAIDRLDLPANQNYPIEAESSITVYYCTASTKWKLLESVSIRASNGRDVVQGLFSKYTTPADITKISVTTLKMRDTRIGSGGIAMTYDKLYAWGDNTSGKLGVGDNTARSSPVAVVGALQQSFKRLAEKHYNYDLSGGGASKQPNINGAIGINDAAYMWGLNTNGGLGDGTVVPKSSPVAVLGGLKFLKIYPTIRTTLGLTLDGTAYGWGLNAQGQIGDGTIVAKSSPVAVLGGFKFSRLAVYGSDSEGMSYGIRKDTGQLYAWGSGNYGQWSSGGPYSSPVIVSATSAKIKNFVATDSNSAGMHTWYALTESGDLYSWGDNTFGQAGTGLTFSPGLVTIGGGLKVKEVWAMNQATVLALTTTGLYYSWGQFPLGITSSDVTSPTLATALNNETIDYSTIRVLGRSIAWQLPDGSWKGMGVENDLGMFGSAIDQNVSGVAFNGEKFSIAEKASGVAYGGSDNAVYYGQRPDGTVYAWGANAKGQLGIGTVSGAPSPQAILGPMGTNPTQESNTVEIPVTASTQYDVKLGEGGCYFGNTPLGSNIDKIIIEYTKRGNS